jgi:hypothetical protein
MSALAETREGHMAKKKAARGKSGGEGRLVRLDPSIVAMAKMIATARGMSLADYLADLLRGPVSREYAKEMRRLEQAGSD